MATGNLEIVIFAYLTSAVVYLVLGLGLRQRRVSITEKLILKCIPVAILACFTALAVYFGDDFTGPGVINVQSRRGKWKLLLVSLVFSLLGDGLLLFKNNKLAFLTGIGTFAGALRI